MHYADCTDNPCICEEIEDRLFQKDALPSPAELIRRAKDQGLLKPSQQYTSDTNA